MSAVTERKTQLKIKKLFHVTGIGYNGSLSQFSLLVKEWAMNIPFYYNGIQTPYTPFQKDKQNNNVCVLYYLRLSLTIKRNMFQMIDKICNKSKMEIIGNVKWN